MFILTSTGIDAESIKNFFTSININKLLPSLLLLVVGFVVVRLIMMLFDKLCAAPN